MRPTSNLITSPASSEQNIYYKLGVDNSGLSLYTHQPDSSIIMSETDNGELHASNTDPANINDLVIIHDTILDQGCVTAVQDDSTKQHSESSGSESNQGNVYGNVHTTSSDYVADVSSNIDMDQPQSSQTHPLVATTRTRSTDDDGDNRCTSPSNDLEDGRESVTYGSQLTDALTVLSPTIERNIHNRNMQTQQEYQVPTSRQVLFNARVGGSSNDTSTMMMTLDEDQELNMSHSLMSGNMTPLHLPNRKSQASMGRRHSMDSNIGRSRPPTFVRTYREVKWKRVSKPFKSHQIPRTSSMENLAAAAQPDGSQAESREYISGTHIIRHRVPIFMTSNDPPDPMGRRFSAGDLIPVTGSGRNWTPNGKCLVIRDMLPSKLTLPSNNEDEDSSSSSSSPASSSEDVRFSQSSDGSYPSSLDRVDHYEFSLIDEDDEDEDDFSEDEEHHKDESKQSSSSSTSSSVTVANDLLPTSTTNTSKHLDLRRLALQKSLQQKSATRRPAGMETVPQIAVTQSSALPVVTQIYVAPTTTQLSVIPTTSQPALTHNTEDLSVVSNTEQPVIIHTTTDIIVTSTTTHSMSATTHPTVSYTADQPGSITTTSVLVPGIAQASTDLGTTIRPEPAVQSSFIHDRVSGTNDVYASSNHIHTPSNVPNNNTVNILTNPSEMPWVMTSTKIADANVYVSSSHSPNSHLNIRSAHWISPRSVEGTIPINLDDAKAIRVETVSVPTSAGSQPLHFQKIIYSTGFIISSAQWVAPTESFKRSQSTNEVRSLPSVESVDRHSELSQEVVSVPSTNDPDMKRIPPCVPSVESVDRHSDPSQGDNTSSDPATSCVLPHLTSKKSRKKNTDKSGVAKRHALSTSHVTSGMKQVVAVRKLKHKVVPVTDEYLIRQELDYVSPSSSDTHEERFDVSTGLYDHRIVPESGIYLQLIQPSSILPSSPTKSKRRFVVEKVPCDPLDSHYSSMNFSRQPMLDFVVSEVKCHPLVNASVIRDSQSSLHLNKSETVNPDLSKHEIVSDVTGKMLPTVAQQVISQVSTCHDVPQSAVMSQVSTCSDVPQIVTEEDIPQPSTAPDVTRSAVSLADNPQPSASPDVTRSAVSQTDNPQPSASPDVTRSAVSPADNPQPSASPDVTRSAVSPADNPQPSASPDVTRSAVSQTDNPQPSASPDVTRSAVSPADNPQLSTSPDMTRSAVSQADNPQPSSSPDVIRSAVSQTDNPQPSASPDVTRSAVSPTGNPQPSASLNVTQRRYRTSDSITETPSTLNSLSELATQLQESSTNCDVLAKETCTVEHTKLRIDTEDDEKFVQENDELLQVILRSLSDTDDTVNSDTTLCGGSTVAIDNKIEQAMDLVKRHLMYAVREEVEILKQQIGEMMDRIGQLEYENTLLRSEAKPETLSKLLQPRLTQPAQTTLSTQPQTVSITSAPATQQTIAAQTQPQQQQQQQQTSMSQVGQPPSTT